MHSASHVAVSVRDLRFAYRRGDTELFGGLSYDFEPGHVTALTGSSGRGKSTLLYVLGLLLKPSGGEVRLWGQTVSGLPDVRRSALRAQSYGFVFQDSVLDPHRTVLDAVLEPAIYAGARSVEIVDRARELLGALGLGARAGHLPGQVSGGQAQRVAIARALLLEPQVLLADEPTGNLDPESASNVLDILDIAAADGRTVIIATHDPVVIARADRRLSL